MSFCVKCGKKGIKGSLCEDCHREENPVLKEFKEVNVEVCAACNAYNLHGKWTDAKNVREGVEKAVKDSIKNKNLKPSINIRFPKPIEELKKERGKKHLEAELKFPDDMYVIPAGLTFTECPRCNKKRSAYFEAILQLRNPKDEIIDFIQQRVESKNKVGIFITAVKKVKNGVDFYITNKKYAMHLGKILQKNFFGILKTSAKLFSRDKNTLKDIYRVNVLFRVLRSHPRDIIRIGEDDIKILGVRGDRIQGMNMKNRKKLFVDPESVK